MNRYTSKQVVVSEIKPGETIPPGALRITNKRALIQNTGLLDIQVPDPYPTDEISFITAAVDLNYIESDVNTVGSKMYTEIFTGTTPTQAEQSTFATFTYPVGYEIAHYTPSVYWPDNTSYVLPNAGGLSGARTTEFMITVQPLPTLIAGQQAARVNMFNQGADLQGQPYRLAVTFVKAPLLTPITVGGRQLVSSWQLEDVTDFDITGTAGSTDFTPTSKTYEVSNTGNLPIEFSPSSITAGNSWVVLSSGRDTIFPGESKLMTITVRPDIVENLAAGSYAGTVTLTSTGLTDLVIDLSLTLS